MNKTSFVFFVSMGLVPIGLINIANLNPFSITVLGIFAFQVPYAFRLAFSSDDILKWPSRMGLLVILTIVISYCYMILNNGKFLDWSVFYSLNYFLFWVFLTEVRSYEDIEQLFKKLKWFVFIAMLWLLFFFLNPSILEGPFKDIRMGSFRGNIAGLVRVFTPGMEYVAYTMVYILSYVFIGGPKKSVVLWLFFALCFLEIAFITSTRTYFVALLVSFLIIMVIRSNRRVILNTAIAACALLLVYFVLPDQLQSNLQDRARPFVGISNLELNAALSGEIGYGSADEEGLGTLYWRLLEIPYVINLIDQPNEVMFGKIGYLYDFLGVKESPMPHTNFLAFYFLFGIVGVVSFTLFIVYFTIKFIKVNRAYQGHPKQYLAVFALLVWINMMLLNGAPFYSPILVGACALIVSLERFLTLQGEAPKYVA